MGRDRLLIGFTSSLNDVSHMGLTKKIVVDHHFSYKHCHFEQADSGRPLFSDAPTSCLSYPMVLGISVLNFSHLWRCHRFSRGRCSFFSPCSWIIHIYTQYVLYIYIYIWILFCPPRISPYLEWFFHFFLTLTETIWLWSWLHAWSIPVGHIFLISPSCTWIFFAT